MRHNVLRALAVIAVAATFATAIAAQEGHPLAGTWYGEYVAGTQKRDLTVILKWDGRNITGSINPGPNASPLKSAVLNVTPGKAAPGGQDSTPAVPPKFDVRFEVDGMTFEGTIQNPVAGNRRITGNWTRGTERGTFQIRRL